MASYSVPPHIPLGQLLTLSSQYRDRPKHELRRRRGPLDPPDDSESVGSTGGCSHRRPDTGAFHRSQTAARTRSRREWASYAAGSNHENRPPTSVGLGTSAP